ncbi:unnamed protein product [Protopolystoma xenopodis]|uniref:Uncharacterized protein n=1 Tax=Protopolystoma xenopodis TaxID=117903 RepID=A0A448WJY6_9PLAT|nr:unnamed protein product [Protopolystoma xenopodis]
MGPAEPAVSGPAARAVEVNYAKPGQLKFVTDKRNPLTFAAYAPTTTFHSSSADSRNMLSTGSEKPKTVYDLSFNETLNVSLLPATLHSFCKLRRQQPLPSHSNPTADLPLDPPQQPLLPAHSSSYPQVDLQKAPENMAEPSGRVGTSGIDVTAQNRQSASTGKPQNGSTKDAKCVSGCC